MLEISGVSCRVASRLVGTCRVVPRRVASRRFVSQRVVEDGLRAMDDDDEDDDGRWTMTVSCTAKIRGDTTQLARSGNSNRITISVFMQIYFPRVPRQGSCHPFSMSKKRNGASSPPGAADICYARSTISCTCPSPFDMGRRPYQRSSKVKIA